MERFKVKEEEENCWWVMQFINGLWWPLESFHSKEAALDAVAQRREDARRWQEMFISSPVSEEEMSGCEEDEDEGGCEEDEGGCGNEAERRAERCWDYGY